MADNTTNSPLQFEVVEELATLSTSGKWRKQLNIVQWGDHIAKYDIRPWNADNTKCGKGITLTLQELKELRTALNLMEL